MIECRICTVSPFSLATCFLRCYWQIDLFLPDNSRIKTRNAVSAVCTDAWPSYNVHPPDHPGIITGDLKNLRAREVGGGAACEFDIAVGQNIDTASPKGEEIVQILRLHAGQTSAFIDL